MKFVVKNPSNHSFFLLQMMMIDGRLETELEKIMAIDVDLMKGGVSQHGLIHNLSIQHIAYYLSYQLSS